MLGAATAELKRRQIDTPSYRISLDNHNLTIGLAAEKLLAGIRNNCIFADGTLPVALFSVRTIQELCLNVAAVNYYEQYFNSRQKTILHESRLMQEIAARKDVKLIEKLLTDEKSKISIKCWAQISGLIDSYDPESHYIKNGFYHQLNDAASKKIKYLFECLDPSLTINHRAFLNFSYEPVEVMFSNLLHGNPTGVLLASDNLYKGLMIPFMLLRMSLYDTELIAKYLGDDVLTDQAIRLREDALKRAFA